VSTPAEMLLRRIRRPCRVESFTVHLRQRYAELRLGSGTRNLPSPIDVVALFTALSGGSTDRIEVYVGIDLAQVHQLVDGRRTWRTASFPIEEAATAA
jgi:hypothetical protein